MVNMLKNWAGAVEVDGKRYDTVDAFFKANIAFGDSWDIKLLPATKKSYTGQDKQEKTAVNPVADDAATKWQITVKQYMTRKSTPEFDFMAKFNNDNPMPLRTMVGTKEKETKGMVYMHLHGVGMAEINCMRCGRKLTHPISRHYGIGPECMQKLGLVCDIEDVDTIKEKLQEVKWRGWVIKSAITAEEVV